MIIRSASALLASSSSWSHVVHCTKMESKNSHVDLVEVISIGLESVEPVGSHKAITSLVNCQHVRPLQFLVMMEQLDLILIRQAGLGWIPFVDCILPQKSIVQPAICIHDHSTRLGWLPSQVLHMLALQVNAMMTAFLQLVPNPLHIETVQVVGAQGAVVQGVEIAVTRSEGNSLDSLVEGVWLSCKKQKNKQNLL